MVVLLQWEIQLAVTLCIHDPSAVLVLVCLLCDFGVGHVY